MRTKIVATLGPASMAYDTLKQMVGFGVRIFRLNFSHSNAATFQPVVKMIRELENELNLPLTAMGDLCGPKTRIGDIEGSPRQIDKDDLVLLGLPDQDPDNDQVFIGLNFPELLKGLDKGMPVSLSDGMLRFSVERVLKADQLFELRSQNGGLLTSHKGITFPGKHHAVRALTPKDRIDAHEGLDIGLDALAMSFVQDRSDVDDLKAEIRKHGTWLPVVAKLERKNAVDNVESILDAADAVMVARGDLGLECPLTELPVIQKRIIRAARHAQKAAIVATQMVLSMVNNPLPTRAEVTDVANAIMDGADCVMLSEETAIGSYPLDVVSLIQGIAGSAEAYMLERIQGPYQPKKEKYPAKYLAYAACLLADNLESPALVCHSTSGNTARLLASRRPTQPIYALTPDSKVLHMLNFYFGIHPAAPDLSIESHELRAEAFIRNMDGFKPGDPLVITSGQPTPGQDRELMKDKDALITNLIKVYYK